jgi:hypothetical protein
MRLRLICSALILTLAVFAPSAFADSYTYTTDGCFGTACSPTTPATLLFADNSLPQNDGKLVFAGVGSTTNTTGTSVDLGGFTFTALNSGTSSPAGTFFTLAVNFTAPTGTTGSPFTALVSGEVFGSGGGASITFNPITQTFTDSDGSFTLTLEDKGNFQVCQPNSPACSARSEEVFGDITPVADASGLSLLGASGLFLLGAIRRKFIG